MSWLISGVLIGYGLFSLYSKISGSPSPADLNSSGPPETPVDPPSIDQREIPDESRSKIASLYTDSPPEEPGEIEALAFVREMRDLQAREEEIPAPDRPDLFVKFERQNKVLEGLMAKGQLPKAMKEFQEHHRQLPHQLSTLTGLVRGLIRMEKFKEAAEYCDQGLASLRRLEMNLSPDFAGQCAAAYQGTRQYSAALGWSFFLYSRAQDEGDSAAAGLHAESIAESAARLGDRELEQKYAGVACRAGIRRLCAK
jgi:hypothetical protein